MIVHDYRRKSLGQSSVIIINSFWVERFVQVLIMARDNVLRAIRDAEIEATETLSEAKKEASMIISQARQKASEIIIEGKSISESDAQDLISETRQSAGSEAEMVAKDGHTAGQKLHNSGKKNRDKAVKLVVDYFRK